MARQPNGLARVAGAVGGLIGLAVSDFAAWLLAPAAAPLAAVGSAIIDLLPAPLVNWGKETLGTADKPILLIIVAAGFLLLCAVGGQLELRRRFLGALAYGAVALVGVAAVLSRQPGDWQAVIPTLVGLAAGYVVLSFLVGKLDPMPLAQSSSTRSGPSTGSGHEVSTGSGPSTGSGHEASTRSGPSTGSGHEVSTRSGPSTGSGHEVSTSSGHEVSTGSGHDQQATFERRGFLRATVLIGAAAVVAATAGRLLVGAAARISEARSRIRLPAPARAARPVPANADLRVPGLSPYVTPNADFYRIDTALQVPVIDPDDWSLRVTGMVERELTISYADLLERPLEEHLTTLTCVSNEVGGDLVGNAAWLGFPIRGLLAEAGPRPGADMVLSRSQDGWTAGTPLDVLTDPNRACLLAVGMNGEPLPVEHGFPVRMVVPGLYGYVSATKWVTELKVTTFEADQGYWTPLGWSALGPIKLASRIDAPRSAVDQGFVTVAGVAWAQHTGIAGVKIRVDDGPWRDAELAETTGPDTWRQWRYDWDAESGNHRLTVLAVDADGRAQVEAEAPPAPDGATGLHTVSVQVR